MFQRLLSKETPVNTVLILYRDPSRFDLTSPAASRSLSSCSVSSPHADVHRCYCAVVGRSGPFDVLLGPNLPANEAFITAARCGLFFAAYLGASLLRFMACVVSRGMHAILYQLRAGTEKVGIKKGLL